MILRMMEKEVDGVFVLTLDGRIVLGEESHFFREKLKDLTDEGKKKIVLNMANINYIDSAGLGTLVAAHFQRQEQGRVHSSLPSGQKLPRHNANDQDTHYL